MANIVDKYEVKEEKVQKFETGDFDDSYTDQYSPAMLRSAWQMKPFFEDKARDADGNLLVDKKQAFNKVGHALHDLHPTFESFAYSQVTKTLAAEVMGFKEPVLLQSMYIFKNPRIGGEIGAHKDSSFLTTKPLSCCGIWIALDSATIENGCMWGVPGSHKNDPNFYLKLRYND